jgi:hypothetical protein
MNTGNSCLNFYAARKLRFSTLAVYCLSLLLSSCAQTPQTITTDEPPQFERLAVITPEMLTGIERADSHTDHHYDGSPRGEALPGMSVGMAGGMAGGAAGGAAIGAAGECGLLAPVVPSLSLLCFAMYTAGGALVGGAAGLAGGALYDTTGLSQTDIPHLDAVISRIDQERDFQQELAVHLKLELPREMQSTPGLADVQVLATLNRINFMKRPDDRMQIETTGLLVVTWKVDEKRQTTHTIEFRSMSSEEDIDLWLADGGNLIGVAISDSLFDLATQMTATLLQAWTPSAIGEIE